MCKIMIIAGLNPNKVEKNWEFIHEMAGDMSITNSDGIGYTAVDEEGNMFGERWHKNEDAFDIRKNPVADDKITKKYLGVLEPDETELKPRYNTFGKYTDRIVAITLHTRYATSGKGFENTHPFLDMETKTSLIHNGVIVNHNKDDEIRSTCDSERILNRYLANEVMKIPALIQSMVNELKGNFACGIISKDVNNKTIIDVFKSRAQLGGAFIKDLGAMVFTTDSTDIKDVCKRIGFKYQNVFKFKEDHLLRFDALTGQPMLSYRYTDTANWTYNNGYTPNHQKSWAEREKEKEEAAKAEAAKQTKTATQTGAVSEADWQNKTEDAATCGLKPRPEDNLVEAKQLVIKHTDMNTTEAKRYGYTYDDQLGWIKTNSNIKH